MWDVFDLFIALVDVLIWHAYFTCVPLLLFFFFDEKRRQTLKSISIFHSLQVERTSQ